MSCIMYNAYQKYYSALKNLERFSGQCSFWDNISSLDNFFSEFRSITFVLQKSIGSDSEKKANYERIRDKHLLECKWFNDTRIQVVHKKPFDLKKQMVITEYMPNNGMIVEQKEYTPEDDEPFDSITNNLRTKWSNENCIEIFFSVRFIFFEEGKKEDLLPKVLAGIHSMNRFMNELYDVYGENDTLCEKLRQECTKLIGKNILEFSKVVFDYIYYPKDDMFERASVNAMIFVPETNRQTLSNFMINHEILNKVEGIFKKFILTNLLMRRIDLMPTFICIYNDHTFSFVSEISTIKTTYYRKINEIANKVRSGDIAEVVIMSSYSTVSFSEEMLAKKSVERNEKSEMDLLDFVHITKDRQEEVIINESDLENFDVALYKMMHPFNELTFGKINMYPITKAFCDD